MMKGKPNSDAAVPQGEGSLTKIRTRVVKDILERLKPFEVEGRKEWQKLANPEQLFVGECFLRSYRFAFWAYLGALKADDPAKNEIWLVHGEFMAFHRHAWVEVPGEVVFDGVTQRFYQRKGYY